MNYFLDLEVYKDYFLASFKREDGAIRHFEMYEGCPLDKTAIKNILRKGVIITFNGNHYDMPILQMALSNRSCQQIKTMSDKIIVEGMKTWNLEKPKCNHIDIKEVATGVAVGLKTYGGRLGMPKLQDLPIEPDASITPDLREPMRTYCVNDLDTTEALYNAIKDTIELRATLSARYNTDVRSKSDAQIAESIFRSYLTGEGVNVGKRQTKVMPFKYRLPDWVHFESPELTEMLEKVKVCTFKVSDAGKPVMPKELNKAIEFAGAKYKFGIGGLHSQEKRQAITPTDNELFGEFDIASMYPSIIIEQELYPEHLGKNFLSIYEKIKNERVVAKKSDPMKAQTYKIVLNGSYGKFGSPYSFLYSPELLIQTTITGQLFLLMAIEKVTKAGGRVVSANTDGINVIRDKTNDEAVHNAIYECEIVSGYEFEYTPYLATYNRDVNSYIAVKSNGVKGKGAFAVGGLMKNPSNNVCIEAVIAYLKDGADIEQHILNEKDITKFLTVRKVTGGAMFRGEEVGKVIRFYHSTDGDVLSYKKNGNKVPKSDGCKPLMNLAPVDDIDFDWYVTECASMIKDLGL